MGTYTELIPVSGDSLGGTRDRIRVNFQQIASVMGINHVAFNALGEGKHKFLQMPEQVSAPATAANEAGFYAKVGTNPAETNLFFRGENSGFEYQLTHAISGATPEGRFASGLAYSATLQGGWTFLPGGLILQYGKRTAPSTSGVITYPIPFPSGTAPYTIQMTLQRTNAISVVLIDQNTPPTSTEFNYIISQGVVTSINWLAIGI